MDSFFRREAVGDTNNEEVVSALEQLKTLSRKLNELQPSLSEQHQEALGPKRRPSQQAASHTKQRWRI